MWLSSTLSIECTQLGHWKKSRQRVESLTLPHVSLFSCGTGARGSFVANLTTSIIVMLAFVPAVGLIAEQVVAERASKLRDARFAVSLRGRFGLRVRFLDPSL